MAYNPLFFSHPYYSNNLNFNPYSNNFSKKYYNNFNNLTHNYTNTYNSNYSKKYTHNNSKKFSNNLSSYYSNNYYQNQNSSIGSKQKKIENSPKREIQEKSFEHELLEIFGLKLYFDDILLICLIFFLYNEGVKDKYLFISLILLLLT